MTAFIIVLGVIYAFIAACLFGEAIVDFLRDPRHWYELPIAFMFSVFWPIALLILYYGDER